MMQRLMIRGALALSMMTTAVISAQEIVPEDVPVVPRPAEIMPKASKSLLLDVTFNGNQYVAVGERGHILASTDGSNWAQVNVPVRSPLTAITFSSPDNGWAVGHDGVILATNDGGKTWVLQNFNPDDEFPLQFLDVHFVDDQRGFAIGTYGLMMETRDGGLNWADSDAPAIRDEELHLNSMIRLNDGTLLVSGETGMMGRSTDDGESWERLESPYESSLFGAAPHGDAGALVYGLRGNLFVTDDVGEGEWRKVETGTVASFFGGDRLPDGGYVMVGLNGTILTAGPAVQEVRRSSDPEGKPLAAVTPIADGLLVVGQGGATVIGKR